MNTKKTLIYFSSLCLFTFFAISLVVPRGYFLGTVLLFIAGLFVVFLPKSWKTLEHKDRLFIFSFLLFAGAWFAEAAFHNFPLSEYDRPFRFVAAVTALFFLIRYPPKQCIVWLGILVGAFATGIWALWESRYLGSLRVGAHTNPIQYGNISILLGFLCLTGIGWALLLPRFRGLWISLLSLGFLFGLTASFLSGSRGGWVSLLFILFYIIGKFRSIVPLKAIVISVLGLITFIGSVYSLPATGVKTRVDQTFSDIQQYQQGNAATSVGTRFELYRGNLLLIADNPIFGLGEYQYDQKLAELKETGIIKPAILSHAHNDMLDVTSRRGLIGLLTLILLYAIPVYIFGTNHNKWSLAASTAGSITVFCYIDFGLTQTSFAHDNGVMMYAFILTTFYAIQRSLNSKQNETAEISS